MFMPFRLTALNAAVRSLVRLYVDHWLNLFLLFLRHAILHIVVFYCFIY